MRRFSVIHSHKVSPVFILFFSIHQTILSGMGELHLEIIHDRIKKEYKLETDLGPLQISYRETVAGPAEESGN